MWRNLLCAVFVLGVTFSLVCAEEIKGRITKADAKDNKVWVLVGKDAKEAKAYDVLKDVKVFVLKKGEKEEVKEGLAAELFGKIDAEKGRGVTLTTNDDNKVTTIILGGKKN